MASATSFGARIVNVHFCFLNSEAIVPCIERRIQQWLVYLVTDLDGTKEILLSRMLVPHSCLNSKLALTDFLEFMGGDM